MVWKAIPCLLHKEQFTKGTADSDDQPHLDRITARKLQLQVPSKVSSALNSWDTWGLSQCCGTSEQQLWFTAVKYQWVTFLPIVCVKLKLISFIV